MSDLISRQVAIDALDCINGVEEVLRALPSAQPEIEERKEESAQNVPKEDLISRKAAIDAECEVCQIAPKKERGHNCTYYVHGCKEIECLRELPSAQPEPCDDAVSRKAVYDAIVEKGQRSRRYKLGEIWELNGDEIREALDTLPSIQPDGWLEQNKDKILQVGMEGREIDFHIGGRLFAIREKAQ